MANFNYPDLFENVKISICNNFDYYTTKIQEIINEISNLKENILELRRRVINLEDEEKKNKERYKKLKEDFDLININI